MFPDRCFSPQPKRTNWKYVSTLRVCDRIALSELSDWIGNCWQRCSPSLFLCHAREHVLQDALVQKERTKERKTENAEESSDQALSSILSAFISAREDGMGGVKKKRSRRKKKTKIKVTTVSTTTTYRLMISTLPFTSITLHALPQEERREGDERGEGRRREASKGWEEDTVPTQSLMPSNWDLKLGQ